MLNYVNERIDIIPPGNSDAGAVDFEEMASTLLTLAKRIRALFGMALAGAGYHNGQDQLLACLVVGERTSVSVIAATLNVRPSTVSKMLDRLAEKGLIERHQVGRDRRLTVVGLTKSGLEAQAEIKRLWSDVCRQVAPGLGADPAKTMRYLQDASDVLATRLMKLR
jgi:DNA-binding MarR family transcriptional regulator